MLCLELCCPVLRPATQSIGGSCFRYQKIEKFLSLSMNEWLWIEINHDGHPVQRSSAKFLTKSLFALLVVPSSQMLHSTTTFAHICFWSLVSSSVAKLIPNPTSKRFGNFKFFWLWHWESPCTGPFSILEWRITDWSLLLLMMLIIIIHFCHLCFDLHLGFNSSRLIYPFWSTKLAPNFSRFDTNLHQPFI